jgi:hypothetical protein
MCTHAASKHKKDTKYKHNILDQIHKSINACAACNGTPGTEHQQDHKPEAIANNHKDLGTN